MIATLLVCGGSTVTKRRLTHPLPQVELTKPAAQPPSAHCPLFSGTRSPLPVPLFPCCPGFSTTAHCSLVIVVEAGGAEVSFDFGEQLLDALVVFVGRDVVVRDRFLDRLERLIELLHDS